MNKLISLSGQGKITSEFGQGGGGIYKIEHNEIVSTVDVLNLKSQINNVICQWNSFDVAFDPIISIRHYRVIPKSLRVSRLFKSKDKTMNNAVVGAYFDNNDSKTKHVIVYRLDINTLIEGINNLDKVARILENSFNGQINKRQMEVLFAPKKKLNDVDIKLRSEMSKKIEKGGLHVTPFGQLIQDISTIESVFINTEKIITDKPRFVSFYDTGLTENELLRILKIPPYVERLGNDIDGYSYLLNPAQITGISYVYPYLVSMSSQTDLSTIPQQSSFDNVEKKGELPQPSNEPIVGVIDFPFDCSADFSAWVECGDNPEHTTDFRHGTAVTSLIVDAPRYNPSLEDGCGRFRVRHFSVFSENGRVPQFELYNRIYQIVLSNLDIKVWNLSIGSEYPIENNSMSLIGALLDRLQAEHDVIFIVAGTNNKAEDSSYPKIGSPADSVNSIVVNAVDKDGKIPEYARKGPVLSFFQGPNLCAIGGSAKDPLLAYSNIKPAKVHGTSFAACWVTRKMAFLIYRLNLTKEIAKALLVDAAYGWSNTSENSFLMGSGILPHNIQDIIYSPADEFKLLVRNECSKGFTMGFNIPLPLMDNKFPFIAKATLCYFPKCSRKQGVDYTLTELDLHFGRMNGSTGIRSINNNKQGNSGVHELFEEDMKSLFRKWDTVKHITEGVKTNPRSKTVLNSSNSNSPFGYWGFKINKKSRLDPEDKKDEAALEKVSFGLVMTFKSIDKRNRVSDFKYYAKAQGWTVNEIDIDVMNEVYEEGQVELEFTD